MNPLPDSATSLCHRLIGDQTATMKLQISLRTWVLLIAYEAALIAICKAVRIAIATYHP